MKRVLIVAGEASGDLHAANLVKAVHRRAPEVEFFGIGGPRMREAGVRVLVDSRELAVVGLVEVLAHRKVIFGALNTMRRVLREERPDLLILIDYPEFNLRLARTAKALGVKVLYYIAPQVWAWRQRRVKTIGQRVDTVAVVFPFEEAFYRRHGVPARFVGHPLADEVAPAADRAALLHEFGLDPRHPVVGLLPGSRRSEISRLLPVLVAAAERLRQSQPDLQFLLPLASTLEPGDVQPYLQDAPPGIHLVPGRSRAVMQACDVVVTASGTATLEVALVGTPMVVIYRVAPLTYAIVRRMLKIPYIALCNIVAGERIVPELIQHRASAENIACEVQRLLDDADYRRCMRERLGTVRAKLGGPGGLQRIADLTLEMLDGRDTRYKIQDTR